MNTMIRSMIRKGEIRFSGNKHLRIYGLLNCAAGKRMKTRNRMFFASEAEAIALGFRPCGNCLRAAYRRWSEESGHVKQKKEQISKNRVE